MSGSFRGYNQTGGSPRRIGPIPQRELVTTLRILIDTARARAASRTRDEARQTLRELMAVANWNTPYVLRNIGAKRCRYLRGLGYAVPLEDAMRSSISRLEQWVERNG